MRERYRKLYCLIWNDDKFPFVSDDCQLVFFHVYFNPVSTPFGLFKVSVEALAADKRWSLKRYSKAFAEGLSKGFLEYDEKHHVLYFPRFLNYNPPANPNVLRSWSSIYNETPNCELKASFYKQLKALVEGYGEGFQEAFAEGFREPCRKGSRIQLQLQSQLQDTGPPYSPPKGDDRFEEFWKVYPSRKGRKQGKDKARELWVKLNPENGQFEKIVAALRVQKESFEWTKEDGQFIPDAQKWLRNKGWNDEVETKAEQAEQPREPKKFGKGIIA